MIYGRCCLARSAAGHRQRPDGRCKGQGGCRIAIVFSGLVDATPLSPTSRKPEEVFTAQPRHVSVYRLSSLHLRMPDLPLISNCSRPYRAVVQPNHTFRIAIYGCEPRCHRSWNKKLVCREVWAGTGGQEMDYDPFPILIRVSALEKFPKVVT